jgi:hypothetical protein
MISPGLAEEEGRRFPPPKGARGAASIGCPPPERMRGGWPQGYFMSSCEESREIPKCTNDELQRSDMVKATPKTHGNVLAAGNLLFFCHIIWMQLPAI